MFFSHICTRIMALDLCQNFVSAQYVENKLTYSPKIIYSFILTSSKFGLLQLIFRTFVPELWPLINARISYPLNILRTNRQNLTKLYIIINIDKI